jgi:hypothetical protein
MSKQVATNRAQIDVHLGHIGGKIGKIEKNVIIVIYRPISTDHPYSRTCHSISLLSKAPES